MEATSRTESDGRIRCPGEYQKDPLYLQYHDEEWGRPCHDEHQLYEMFIIELFQAGLSWRTLLHKRKNFEKAYDGFDLLKVAEYGEEKVRTLMQDAGIIRSEAKIRASILNSRIIRDKILPHYGSFDAYVWHFTKGKSVYEAPGTAIDVYSDSMAKELKELGMKFAGSVTLFSYLQAIGVINSHTKDCFCYQEIKDQEQLSERKTYNTEIGPVCMSKAEHDAYVQAAELRGLRKEGRDK